MSCSTRRMLYAIAVGAVFVGMAAAAPVSESQLAEWPLGGNADQWQYSSLKQINDGNVGGLGLAWAADLPVIDGLVGSPLVMGGVVYDGAPGGVIIANDLRTGKLLWMFTPKPRSVEELKHFSWTAMWANEVNRGMAIDQHNTYIAAGDCRLFAVNRITGKLVWETPTCDPTKEIGAISVPRVGGGMVFLGNSEAEEGHERSHVDAFDAASGRHLWRFYTVPGDPAKGFESPAMEMASRTWAPGTSPRAGAVWSGMLYDEKLQRLYFGVGNPEPHEPGWQQLFGDSIVAVEARSGKLIWYFQEVPGGVPCDCDAVAEMHLAELPTAEGVRRVVMQAAKDGFFYVLDAQTGRFLSANNYVPDNWASGVDANGQLVLKTPDRQGDLTIMQPGGMGGHSWTYGAYNPQTRVVYIPGWIWPDSYGAGHFEGDEDPFYGLSANAIIKTIGRLIAWDPITQRERWHVDQRLPLNGGVLATAGNLVFQGTAEGTFNAYAADSGKQLWTFDAHATIHAPPITVELDGKQIILVPSGDGASNGTGVVWPRLTSTPQAQGRSRLLAFELGGHGTVAPTPIRTIPRPFRPLQPADLAQRGARLYLESHCDLCHGWEAEKGGLRIPDLRTISREVYDEMPNILIRGSLIQGGMPIFPKLTEDDIRAIQAYLTNQAWAGYDRQQQK